MDILINKYISDDEILNILLNTPAKDIVNLSNVNKKTRQITANITFWQNYINNSQLQYNKLMLALAKNGGLSLFKQLWPYSDNKLSNIVISEPKILKEAFELSFLNGHETMADYIYALDAIWRNILRDNILYSHNKINMNLTPVFNIVNAQWRHMTMSLQKLLPGNITHLDIKKLELSMRSAIISGDIAYIKIFVDHYDELVNSITNMGRDMKLVDYYDNLTLYRYKLNRRISNALSYAKSLKFLDSIKKLTTMDLGTDYTILRKAISNGNYKLATQLYNKMESGDGLDFGDIQSFAKTAIKSPYPQSLQFIRTTLGYGNDYANIFNIIGNKYVFEKLFSQSDDKLQNEMIFASYSIFKPYEYVNLILERIGCLKLSELNALIIKMLYKGYWSMTTIIQREMSVCDDQ